MIITLEEKEQIEEVKKLIQKALTLLYDLDADTKNDALSNELSRAISRVTDANTTIENI